MIPFIKITRLALAASVVLIALFAPGAMADQAGDQPEDQPGESTRVLQEMAPERQRPLIPRVLPAVEQRIAAPFNSEDDRRELRIKHGLWTDDDLDTPARRARAALIAGAIDHMDLFDERADPLDRAEAARRRGELEDALDLLEGESSLRAIRIRAQALFQLGRFEDADAAVTPAVERLARVNVEDAGELAEGVRALQIRARIRGPERVGGGDYETMLSLLKRGRERLDRLSWRVRLAEAELLYDKHNIAEAATAATEALRRNPRSARALALLGRITVDRFDMDTADRIAAKLDELAGEAGGANPAGARTLGRARLRRRDPEGALMALGETLELFPTQRTALALEAAATAATFDEEGLEADLSRFDGLSPGSPRALYEVGRVLAEARQYGWAESVLNRAIERLPNWPHPHIELGLLSMQAGEDAQAIESLSRAAELDRWDVRAANSLRLITRLQEYETVESEHFAVRYKPGLDGVLAREMVPVLERIHARLTSDPASEYASDYGEDLPGGLGHEPARKTRIELLPNHSEFAVRITGMPAIHTIAASTGPIIAMETPREGPDHPNGTYDWPRVVQHEYVHTVNLSMTNNRIPHWFTEASAVFYEDAPRDEDRWRLLARVFKADELFDLEEINVAFVRPKKPSDRAQAYAQGHWMYQFMAERWGAEAPVSLMYEYAAGVREEAAFQEVLGVGRAAFLEDFLVWAEGDLRRVGMLPSEGMPTLTELLEGHAETLPEDQQGQWRPDDVWVAEKLAEYPDHPGLLELLVAQTLGGGAGPAGPDPRAAGPRERGLSEADVRLLEDYAEVRPVSDLPHRRLALHYLDSGDPEVRARAIEHLAFLDEREQSSAAFSAALVRLYSERGMWPEATVHAERAVRVDPFDAELRELAARVALVRGQNGTARRHLEALAEIEPDREIHKQRLEAVGKIAGGAE